MTGDRSEDSPPPGVFGNLPASRPGTRSPRRDRATKRAREEPQAEPPAAGEPAAVGAPPPPEAGSAPSEPAGEGQGEPAGEGQGGLEELAWAGVAIAAEAATIGVRLASRAMEAVRGSDRR